MFFVVILLADSICSVGVRVDPVSDSKESLGHQRLIRRSTDILLDVSESERSKLSV